MNHTEILVTVILILILITEAIGVYHQYKATITNQRTYFDNQEKWEEEKAYLKEKIKKLESAWSLSRAELKEWQSKQIAPAFVIDQTGLTALPVGWEKKIFGHLK